MTDTPWYPPEPDGSPGQGWHEHTPSHPMPCEPDAIVDVVTSWERQSRTWGEGSAFAENWLWERSAGFYQVVAWRYACPAMRRLAEQHRIAMDALQQAVDAYGKPGGPWNVPSDPGGWLERARDALRRIEGAGEP